MSTEYVLKNASFLRAIQISPGYIKNTTISKRSGRAQDKEDAYAMQKLRSLGVYVMRKFLKKKKIVIGFGMVALLLAATIFYLSFFKKGFGPGSLTIDCAYFRKLSEFDNGTIYLFLKNEGKRPAKINKIILDDIPLPDLTLSELIDEGDMADSGLIPSLKVEEDDRVLWYYVYPNPIPAGKTAKVVVKCNFPPYKLISIAAEDAKGKRYRSIIQPQNNPLRFTYIGFSKELNKVFLYLENSETTSLQIARVYINGQDVIKDSFKPWEYLNSNEKKCIEVNFKTPLTKGEFVAAKVITTDGLATESLVRVSSFFPITTDSGSPEPDLNLDNENYLANFSSNFYNKDTSKNILYNVLDCPTHAHGTWRNAGAKAIARTTTCRDNDPYHLTYVGICKANQKRGSFAFAEIADTVKENPVESSTWSSNPWEHPTQTTAQIAKDASSPNPWLSIVQLTTDDRIESFHYRIPTPNEARLLTYCALSRGAKGIFYRLPSWENQASLKSEVKVINLELQQLKNFLAISEPISLATCSQLQVESCTLQAGYNGIILFLINYDTKSTPDGFTYKPKTNFTVKVKIPEGVKVEWVNEVLAEKLISVNYNIKDEEIILPIDKLNLTRQFLIKASPLYEINKSQSLEVKESNIATPITISEKGTPKEILTEAKTTFDKINKLKWYPQNLKEYDKVIVLVKKVISNSKDKVLILNAQKLITDCYHNQAEYQKEKEVFDKYIDTTEKYYGKEQAVQELVKAGDSFQHFDAAYYFRKLLDHYPSDKLAAYAQYKLAATYAAMDNTDKAIDGYRTAIIRYPQEKEWVEKSYLALVGAYGREGKYIEATATLKELLFEIPPDSSLVPNIKFYLGYFYYKQGNQVEARKVFTDLIQKYPKSTWAFQASNFY